jgi:carbon-monoxide dehydrogenase large subunit
MSEGLDEGVSGIVGRFGSGQAVRRLEDPQLVSGHGYFADDAIADHQSHLAFLRSPYAHADIISIDVSAALAIEGVIAVYTGADLIKDGVKSLPGATFKRPDGGDAASPERFAMAHQRVRFVGEAVAAVVAESRSIARNAINAIMVDYAELPSVTGLEHAASEGAPLLVPEAGDNICAQMRHGDAASAAAVFERAAHVIKLHLVNQRLAPSPMEPRATLAVFDAATGRTTVRMSSQMPSGVRGSLLAALNGEKDSVRILVGDVGGGFGMKTGAYPEDIVLAYATKKIGRPVKWAAERSEEFLAANHGRDVETDAELALDQDGRMLALRTRSKANVGAYGTGAGVAIQLMIGPWVSTSIYDIKTVDLEITAYLTNTSPTGAYRGAGRPEAIYIIERLLDAAARKLGMDPSEIRRINMVKPEQMPYKNALSQTYDSGRFEQILDGGLKLADWSGFAQRRAESQKRGKLRGRGIATFLEWTGGNAFEERVTITVTPDGFIEIGSATQAMGQGIATSYAQLAVDTFKVPIEKIRILQGDTDRANGFGSAGSRSLFTGGSAIEVAAKRTIEESKEKAAEQLEAPVTDIEYDHGRFVVAGTDHAIDLFTLAGKQSDARIHVDSTSSVAGPTWPNGCHVAEIEIDPDTGECAVVAYASMNDVGRVVNPTIVIGQIEGGAVQGIGQALSEHVVYDAETGQALTATFLDYAMPRVDLAVPFKTAMDQSVPCLTNPLGVKGVGELGTIGATPALINAILDALQSAGVGDEMYSLQMPATSERIWQILQHRKS